MKQIILITMTPLLSRCLIAATNLRIGSLLISFTGSQSSDEWPWPDKNKSGRIVTPGMAARWHILLIYPKKYAHGFCFAVLCCGYTLTDFPISIRLTSLALWQSNDCPSASKATRMNVDKYFMWIHYERLHNHNKAKHNKTVCIFLGIYCSVAVHHHNLLEANDGVDIKPLDQLWRRG